MQKRIIVAPPPFTNGALHLGHYYQYSLIDSYISFLKSNNFNSNLILGFDVHGLANNLKILELKRSNPLIEFGVISEIYIENNITQMLNQFKAINITPVHIWSTHDFKHKLNVQLLINSANLKGLLEYSSYLQEYCPNCHEFVVLSDLTSKNKEVKAYNVTWLINNQEYITLTTQPELLPFAKAIFYNPSDERYMNLANSLANIYELGLTIPVFSSSKVSISLGSGLVFVSSYGSRFDYDLLQSISLECNNFIDGDGLVNNKNYFVYKKECISELLNSKLIHEQLKTLNVQRSFHSERSSCNSEIVLVKTKQLYIKTSELKAQLLKMLEGMVIMPNTYRFEIIEWINNMQNWCISRNYLFGSNCFLNQDLTPYILLKDKLNLPLNYRYDCWVDSSITWLTTQQYEQATECFAQFQGYEIVRTWLIYSMISAAILDFKYPFKIVKLLPLILGKNNKKLSKSNPETSNIEVILSKYSPNILRLWSLLRPQTTDSQCLQKDFMFINKFLIKLKNIKKFISLHATDLSLVQLPSDMQDLLNSNLLSYTATINKIKLQLLDLNFTSLKKVMVFVINDLSNDLLTVKYVSLYKDNLQFITKIHELYELSYNLLKSLCPLIDGCL